MKKYDIFIIVPLLFLSIFLVYSNIRNCYSKVTNDDIITRTYQDKNMVIGVNYPKTNTNLDKDILEYVNTQLDYFKSNFGDSDYLIDRDEINIDYKYKVINNRYISLVLTTYINSYKLTYPIYDIKSYFYDIKNSTYLTLNDLFDEENKLVLFNYVGNKLKTDYENYIVLDNIENFYSLDNLAKYSFYVDADSILIYFTPDQLSSDYYDLLTISVPLSLVKFNIDFKIDENMSMIKYDSSTVSNIIDPKKKVVALTFDDGPSIYTKDIIDILKEEDVNATFFILGNKVETYQNVLIESIKNGNELGNHSYNHKWLSKLSIKNLTDQIESTQEIIKEKLNYEPVFLRPTYGSVTNRIRNNTNLKIALWSVDTKDWKIKNVDRIIKKATENIKDGDVILMHDIFERTSLALKGIISELKSQDFQFVTLSELEEIELLRLQMTN